MVPLELSVVAYLHGSSRRLSNSLCLKTVLLKRALAWSMKRYMLAPRIHKNITRYLLSKFYSNKISPILFSTAWHDVKFKLALSIPFDKLIDDIRSVDDVITFSCDSLWRRFLGCKLHTRHLTKVINSSIVKGYRWSKLDIKERVRCWPSPDLQTMHVKRAGGTKGKKSWNDVCLVSG